MSGWTTGLENLGLRGRAEGHLTGGNFLGQSWRLALHFGGPLDAGAGDLQEVGGFGLANCLK